jgi:subtilase family serine protease
MSKGSRMFRTRRGRQLLVAAAVTATGALAVSSPSFATGRDAGQPAASPAGVRGACGAATAGHARCFAEYRSARPGVVAKAAAAGTVQPAGYGPADLASAYRLPSRTAGRGRTIAIVDAFDNPNAEADLATYRKTFGLPACTTASGCFRKVNQRGAVGPLPGGDQGWGFEIALDVQMASAICPRCGILLVETDDDLNDNLAAGVDTAVRLGATVVSNSYGSDEITGSDRLEPSYTHPGVPIVASSGDSGFRAAQVPAAYPSVIAVGGTTLSRAGNRRGWTESAWTSGGSGCSAWFGKPRWQRDRNCPMRTVADVSAVADPETGVAVHDTFLPEEAVPGWQVAGGTSASAPIIAGVYALAGHTRRVNDASGLYRKSARPHLFDPTGGSNGLCGDDYLCTGLPGYDAPTGAGSPNGTGAF